MHIGHKNWYEFQNLLAAAGCKLAPIFTATGTILVQRTLTSIYYSIIHFRYSLLSIWAEAAF